MLLLSNLVWLFAANPDPAQVLCDSTLPNPFQDWTKRSVENLLAQMSEADAQRGSEVISPGSRVNLERSVDGANNVPPRERKAGCKNFYWKGYTSC